MWPRCIFTRANRETPLTTVESVEAVAGKGILGEPRYFGRVSRDSAKPSRRQLSLIEREQIAEHAATLGLQTIAPGAVRSNVETEGIYLIALVGNEVEIGDAVIRLYAPRDPCAKMDAICPGLRELMLNNRQGVMAEVVRSGKIRRGDRIARKTAPATSCPGETSNISVVPPGE